MKWLEIAVYTTDAGLGPVCDALSGAGVDAVSIEESREKAMAFLNERAVYWDYADAGSIGSDAPCVKAYLADTAQSRLTLDEIKSAVARLRTLSLDAELGSLSVVVSRVDDEDWANNWKKYYKPLPIGERLLVLPSWEPRPDTPRTVLTLDPGVAFGTGSHHTTRMCLEFLERTVTPGCSMLDLGCGSGILSIAALLLGAKSAAAVDVDPVAEHVARENAEKNDVPLTVLIGDLLTDKTLREKLRGQYDVVAANIVASVIVALAPFARACVRPGGAFLVSGVIDDRADEVRAALLQNGFAVEETACSESWVAFLCRG